VKCAIISAVLASVSGFEVDPEGNDLYENQGIFKLFY
jgi:hypothetical protein